MLKPVKQKIRLRVLFSTVMIGYLLNNLLPRAGELGRSFALAKVERIKVGSVLAATAAERAMDVITLLLLVLIVPILYTGPLMETFPWLRLAQWIGFGGSALAVGVVVAAVLRRDLAVKVMKSFLQVFPDGVALKLFQFGDSLIDGVMFIREPRTFGPIFLLTMGTWIPYALMIYCGFEAFGLHHSLSIGAAVVVLAISSIGVAIPTPGGAGSYHLFVVGALTGLYGIERSLALSFATTVHGVIWLGTCLVGLVFLVVDQVRIADAMGKGKVTGTASTEGVRSQGARS